MSRSDKQKFNHSPLNHDYRNSREGTCSQCSTHRRIADEYCGGAAVTKFPTKYFRIEFMRREFVVRVIVLYS